MSAINRLGLLLILLSLQQPHQWPSDIIGLFVGTVLWIVPQPPGG